MSRIIAWTTACFCGTVSKGTVCPTCGRCSLPPERGDNVGGP